MFRISFVDKQFKEQNRSKHTPVLIHRKQHFTLCPNHRTIRIARARIHCGNIGMSLVPPRRPSTFAEGLGQALEDRGHVRVVLNSIHSWKSIVFNRLIFHRMIVLCTMLAVVSIIVEFQRYLCFQDSSGNVYFSDCRYVSRSIDAFEDSSYNLRKCNYNFPLQLLLYSMNTPIRLKNTPL